MSAIASVAFLDARRCAVAKPMPDAAPVIAMTRPLKSAIVVTLRNESQLYIQHVTERSFSP